MGLNAVWDSDCFFVPLLCDVDQFTFHKNLHPEGQTSWAKSSSQLVNLPGAHPLINRIPAMLFLQPGPGCSKAG